MHVKRFEAADMAEALRMVKLELGPNAIILSTRQGKKDSGVFGMFGRSFVEVTAAVDREAVDPSWPAPQSGAVSAASMNSFPSDPPASRAWRQL